VLDHAVGIRNVEFTVVKWQTLCGVSAHKRARISRAVKEVHPRDVEVRSSPTKPDITAPYVQDPSRGSDGREAPELLKPSRSGSLRKRVGEAAQRTPTSVEDTRCRHEHTVAARQSGFVRAGGRFSRPPACN
jgi:hypothetical protein